MIPSHKVRVWLNNVDISAIVSAADVTADVGQLVTSRITVLAVPRIEHDDEGTVHFRFDVGTPARGPIITPAGREVRGIRLRPDDTSEVW